MARRREWGIGERCSARAGGSPTPAFADTVAGRASPPATARYAAEVASAVRRATSDVLPWFEDEPG
jgi:hypothetical protein